MAMAENARRSHKADHFALFGFFGLFDFLALPFSRTDLLLFTNTEGGILSSASASLISIELSKSASFLFGSGSGIAALAYKDWVDSFYLPSLCISLPHSPKPYLSEQFRRTAPGGQGFLAVAENVGEKSATFMKPCAPSAAIRLQGRLQIKRPSSPHF